MNSLFLAFLVLIIFCFHGALRIPARRGKVKESFCAMWCIDSVFAICGTVISFTLYNYTFLPFFTWRNILVCLLYLVLTFAFILIAPSGLLLFKGNREHSLTTMLPAEYRFNDTLCLVRSFFLVLLFVIPILMTALFQTKPGFLTLGDWNEQDICGAVCFIAFLFLIPLSLRQTLFWLRNLFDAPSAEEEVILKKYRTDIHFHKRNHRI